MRLALATVLHDPADRLLSKVEEALPQLADRLDGVGVMASVDATRAGLAAVGRVGAHVEQETMPSGVLTIGRRRRGALAVALRSDPTHIISSDIDHVLRWWERDRDDFERTVAAVSDVDLLVVGRAPVEFDRTPAPLRDTEALVNRFYEARTGRRWDLFLALRIMTADVARAIVSRCDEDTIATDVAWPLFAEGEGKKLDYHAAPVDYETADWYATGVSERDAIERDPRAWAFRFDLGRQMFEAFDRWAPATMRS